MGEMTITTARGEQTITLSEEQAAQIPEIRRFTTLSEARKLTPAALTLILRLRKRLVRESYAQEREALLAMQREALMTHDPTDEQIIRLSMLITDLTSSLNRIGSRLAYLADIHYPTIVRSVPHATLARIIIDTPHELSRGELSRPPPERIAHLLKHLANTYQEVNERIHEAEDTVRDILTRTYPNFTRIATERLAHRFITHAGGLENIARTHASKIQLLGAESALFRHLRNKRNRPPKHGIIHEHPFLTRVRRTHRGRMARMLADKLVIAAKMDYFGSTDHTYAEAMLNALNERATEWSA